MVLIWVLLLCGACTKPDTEEEKLLGKWQIEWTDTSVDPSNTNNYTCNLMKGEINFKDQGVALIKGFGHQGCVFLQDTTSQVLRWELSENQIKFSDKDRFLLSYQINVMTNNSIDCQLLDDIKVKISK